MNPLTQLDVISARVTAAICARGGVHLSVTDRLTQSVQNHNPVCTCSQNNTDPVSQIDLSEAEEGMRK